MAGFPCWEPLEKQFSVATELGPDHIGNSADGNLGKMISNDFTPGYLTAVNPANQLHNNSMDYVAGDGTRVVLQPPVSGTDYVNASWVPGYSGDRAFIISQHPNNFSLEQFWHMVWQTDTRTIICLSAFQQPVSDARAGYQMLSSSPSLKLHFNVRCGRSCLYASYHFKCCAVSVLHAVITRGCPSAGSALC